MGIHIPLSLKAQAETRISLISANNCTLPSTGQPNLLPSQDMILGYYFLTTENISLNYLLKKIMGIKTLIKRMIKEIIKNKM